jgi:RNA polymerase sigma factor (sigma-70 family)
MQESASGPEALFVTHLDLLERVIRSACRPHGMEAEVEDFSSWVKVRFIEDDYRIIRMFEGRCSMATYFFIVVQRLLSDYRNHLWGKWRPSVEAQNLGPLALRIEILLSRDRLPPDEALRALRDSGATISAEDFDALAARIPKRRPRTTFVDASDAHNDLAVSAEQIESDAASDERSAVAEVVVEALRSGLAVLPAEDRAILRLHFDGGASVAEIARILHLEQKPLYRRIRRICNTLRDRLLDAGVDADKANEIIGRPDIALDVGLRAVGNSQARPSPMIGSEPDAEDQVSR